MSYQDHAMPRHRSSHWHVLAAITLAVAAANCTSAPPPVAEGPVAVAKPADPMLTGVRDTAKRWPGLPYPLNETCGRMEWAACDPLWTDDQALKDNANDYGPHAYIIPTRTVARFTQDADFNTAKLVGLVYVKPGSRPQTYKDLNLTKDFTCIFIQSSNAPSVIFRAFLVPNSSGDCTSVVPAGAAFDVRAAPVPPTMTTGTEAGDAALIPPVARFHEGLKGSDKETPLLGVRCGSKWCIILPSGRDSLSLPHKNDHPNLRTWEVHGWHDVQHLSKRKATGGGFDRTAHESSIIPDVDLATKNFGAGAQHAATIKFWSNPTGDYANKWGFSNGENELYLMKVTLAGKEYWHGAVMNRHGAITPVYVEKWHPGTNPPATARFRWDDADEGIWVACEGGCCYVSSVN
jgi:hypothetical protein